MTAPTRPALRYHGGKWKLASWIISHFPPHRTYTEPYGGAASVLLQKPRAYAEVYNDLDGEIVNLFWVLRSPGMAEELERQLRLTPYAKAEFDLSYTPDSNPVEQARRTLVRAQMGFGSAGASGHQTGFRSNVTRAYTTPASDWSNYPDLITSFTERLRGVTIENRSAEYIIGQYDGPHTLHYVDPPYPLTTRTLKGHYSSAYRYEMTDDDHRGLARVLRDAAGYVVLSGYACELYDVELYPDWQRIKRDTHADGALDRTEVLWLSPRTWQALQDGAGLPLFSQAQPHRPEGGAG